MKLIWLVALAWEHRFRVIIWVKTSVEKYYNGINKMIVKLGTARFIIEFDRRNHVNSFQH